MKKLILLIAAVAVGTVSSAQIVLGLQGGYYWQKNTTSLNDDYTEFSNTVGCVQVGYKVTPYLQVGLMGGYISAAKDTLLATDTYFYPNPGMNINVTDHRTSYSRSGWFVAPQVKYEFLRYGNMRFNLLFQASLKMLGATTVKENYTTTTYPNPNEYMDVDPYDDKTSYMSWGVSLRPTLVYEFSEHLSAELMLDLLSIGYLNEKETYDPEITGVDPVEHKGSYFYAGINSLTEVLRWENTMLKLGFNWTF